MTTATKTGEISTYVSMNGWGYVRVRSSASVVDAKYFFHISNYHGKSKPEIGKLVTFEVLPEKQGKYPSAINVTPIE
jgi:hypothetical protein